MSPVPRGAGTGRVELEAVVLDVDGTVLNSADGIVAAYRHALAAVGVAAPDEAGLRADLGPPLVTLLPALGVPSERLAEAAAAYRTYYLRAGLHQARPYDGVVEVLARLSSRVRLATATAKRTDTAAATLEAHGLSRFFTVVNGLDDDHPTKTATLGRTLELLGDPEPARIAMVGDRHSDVSAGRDVGARTVGVLWGYGSRAELEAAGPDLLLEHPAQLVDLLG
ncbi:phosphoglycolate phosphatase [Microlunatus sagamiharensis]|uniref:Phosphoglycolate phosphatase n=1 Tax=Microlunatus sagamiharensis TaxID=546874 RepID=A0A1H2MBS6_9ACTN|nr:HAD hydrolase-like protein [Microlunatus sagamiharensis]SDU90700.1 phosphoglycolate phosphatase [Microlunatus sagamiharensis]